MIFDEADRRKQVIKEGRTDVARWANPAQLETAWDARALIAADFIPAGSRVLDIGCGAMKLELHLPFGCSYVPSDVVRRDDRTIVVDLNENGLPARAVADADWVVMLGVWEYLYKPAEILAALGRTGKSVLCSYCTRDTTSHLDRQSLGWVNDFSLAEFIELAQDQGYAVALHKRIDPLQYLFKLTKVAGVAPPRLRRVHVISYNNVGNFGDRLGYHLVNDVLPAHAEVSWGTLRPFTPVADNLDLLIIGIGNSLFGDLMDDPLIQATKKAKSSIGIFGTQYRETLPADHLRRLLEHLTHWYARNEDDVHIYGRGRDNVAHLGDWLINAFPLACGGDDRVLSIGQEIWQTLPLDRTIQRIQLHRKVFSERLHPLLCALTSAADVAYKEQREGGRPAMVSGKFRSMFMDIFGQTFPESSFWAVDRDRVAAYKAQVRRNSDEMRRRLAVMLG